MKSQTRNDDMSTYLSTAQRWGRWLEDHEVQRSGLPLQEARKIVSRRTRVCPGTLERLRSGRMKDVVGRVITRLSSAVAAELQAEILRLEHELQLARQCGADARGDEMAAAAAALEKARQLLGKG